MNLYFTHFAFLLVVMTTNKAAAFSVGGTFLSAAEKAALEKTAEAVATAGKGITGKSHKLFAMKSSLTKESTRLRMHRRKT